MASELEVGKVTSAGDVVCTRGIVKKSTGSGNTLIKIENDSASNAAVLELEGKRTSDNDCAQILIANSGENVAAIKGFRSGANDAGKLELHTSASGSSGLASRLSIASTGLATFSNGIAFGSQTNTSVNDAAVDTNGTILDHYESGTWTPSDGSGAELTFSSESGYYTRIGQVVHTTFALQYPSNSDSTTMKIAGLPFTPRTSYRFGGSWGYASSGVVADTAITNNTTRLVFRISGGSTLLTNTQLSNVTVRGNFTFVI